MLVSRCSRVDASPSAIVAIALIQTIGAAARVTNRPSQAAVSARPGRASVRLGSSAGSSSSVRPQQSRMPRPTRLPRSCSVGKSMNSSAKNVAAVVSCASTTLDAVPPMRRTASSADAPVRRSSR